MSGPSIKNNEHLDENIILKQTIQNNDKLNINSTFARSLANDFNNLLMAIQGIVSVSMLDLEPSHPLHKNLRQIEEQVQYGVALTNKLLGFVRDNGFEEKPSDMNDIIQKTLSAFVSTKKNVSIERKIAEDLWMVKVDREQIEHVFLNLYTNACLTMPKGGEIYLETENVLLNDDQALSYAIKPGKYVKITVADTGTGIDEKTKGQIFDQFFTAKRMGKGAGLGLANVYRIIRGHEGIINVNSEMGQGTTFTIYLPAFSREEMLGKKIESESEIISIGTETILLVDDEEPVREVDKTMLEFMGYHVYLAASGQEAISIYMTQREKIDLVILDMGMPGMTGGETFDRLKEINPNINVLLCSGYSLNGQAQEILSRGCNGFIQKPFRLSQFSRKIREMLD